MDLTPHIPALIEGRPQVQALMQGTSTVACMGSRSLLSLFVCAAPFPESLVGAVTTEAEALALVERHRPTFLFVTEQLEQGDGLSLVQRSHRLLPELRSLLILQSETQDKAQRAIELGCNGVVVESRLAEGAMVQAIRAVVGGGLYLDGLSVEALRSSNRGSAPEPIEPLSPREQEVLQLVLQGCTNREMAACLIVSPETIKTHVANIISKLQARDRTQAAVIGLRLGLVSWGPA
jgi:DNA-binding NarL/FixJ family response regulator